MPNWYPSAPTTCAASTAAPQPPNTSQNVPRNSATSRFIILVFPGNGPQEGRGGMLEQVLAEDVRTALRRCAAERATRRGCADSPGRPGGGRPGCAAAGDQLLVSCGPVKRSIRSEERRVGKECGSTCRSWRWP